MGDFENALSLAKNVLSLSKNNQAQANIIAQSIIGEAYHCQGELALAYLSFQEVKTQAKVQNMHQTVIWSLYQQAEILYAQSHCNKAKQHIKKAIELLNLHHLQNLPLYVFPLHFNAELAYQDGDFVEAERLCKEAFSIIAAYGETWVLYSYTMQSKIALEQNNIERAKYLIGEIELLLRNKIYHSDWLAAANYSRLKYWRLIKDIPAIERWLKTAPKPLKAFNRFDQCHNRNRVRALIQLGRLEDARELLEENLLIAKSCQLHIDINRNLILLTSVESRLNLFTNAKLHLSEAVESSLFTGLKTNFVRESNNLKPIYQLLLKDPTLVNAVKLKLSKLLFLSGINLAEPIKNPFKREEISKIQAHPQAPRLVKNIPLTAREWEVLGFIYSGYRNHQIAKTMGVAATTVKSHIRNIYQKLGLENRKEAILLAEHLLTLLQ
ncbi:MAG: hypothetical protein KAI17_16855 [Thiotrichaceae bacterium]|nr:hypothetical protein [Thiotrichaceae bacterium]